VATRWWRFYVLVSAVRYRVPKIYSAAHGTNIAIYFLVGLLPFIGDLFDAWWKPNIRNIKSAATTRQFPAEAKREPRLALFVA